MVGDCVLTSIVGDMVLASLFCVFPPWLIYVWLCLLCTICSVSSRSWVFRRKNSALWSALCWVMRDDALSSTLQSPCRLSQSSSLRQNGASLESARLYALFSRLLVFTKDWESAGRSGEDGHRQLKQNTYPQQDPPEASRPPNCPLRLLSCSSSSDLCCSLHLSLHWSP